MCVISNVPRNQTIWQCDSELDQNSRTFIEFHSGNLHIFRIPISHSRAREWELSPSYPLGWPIKNDKNWIERLTMELIELSIYQLIAAIDYSL